MIYQSIYYFDCLCYAPRLWGSQNAQKCDWDKKMFYIIRNRYNIATIPMLGQTKTYEGLESVQDYNERQSNDIGV